VENVRPQYSKKPFAEALTDLLRKQSGDPRAKVSLRDFSGRVDGWKYETLRKQIVADRKLQPEAIEAMADALGVSPEHFLEYRQSKIQQAISDHPELVDLVYDLLVSRAKSLDAIAVPIISRVLDTLVAQENLGSDLAGKVLELIMDGQVGDAQSAAFLMGLRVKGETGDEIFGMAETMRKFGTPVHLRSMERVVDIVGTGGDRLATFNISTTAAFVAVAAGARIPKHGSRGQTSSSGSADFVQALGANIDLSPERVVESVDQVGIGFMFAPLYYKVIRNLFPLRRSLNMRTTLNFIGPLLNPANVKRQLTGVSDPHYLKALAEALGHQGAEHAWLVYGDDGLDELSITGPTTVVEVREGVVGEPFSVSPEMYGLQRHGFGELIAGTPERNAEVSKRVLSGEQGGALDIVALNAGAALFLAGVAESVADGVERALEAVESGKAWNKMMEFVDFSRRAD